MIEKDEKILVTGGKGFIGSHLIDFLIDKGYRKVYSLDRDVTVHKPVYTNENCKYLTCSLTDFYHLKEIFEQNRFSYIFHFAGNSNVPLSGELPFMDFESNALGTLNLYQAAYLTYVKKIVFTSSASVYGQPEFVPVTEVHPQNPVSNYALTKLYGEKLALAYQKSYNVNSSVIRIFSSYGPRQPRYILYDLLKKINLDPEHLSMLGTPDTIRDYIFIEDTVRAFYQVMCCEEANGEVFNLAGGNPIRIIDFIRLVCEIVGVNPEIRFSNNSWKGDIKVFNADISKIQRIVGFTPMITLEEGILKTVNWFRANKYI